MRAVLLVALAVGSGGGCAAIARHQLARYEQKVTAYEHATPDGEALGRGDLRTTTDMLDGMGAWTDYLQTRDLPPVDRQRLVDRMHEASRQFRLAAAHLADTPDLAYALARTALTDDDPVALAAVRAYADARAARRQELLADNHTYFIAVGPDVAFATTSSSTTIVDGQVVAQSEHRELVDQPGNCVFATRPFAAEGVRNDGLTFRIRGERAVIHARCYLRRDPLGLPRDEAEWVIETNDPAGAYAVKAVPPRRPADRYRDFVLTRAPRNHSVRFAPIEIGLTYEYTDGYVVVWEDGGSRLRKQRKTISLAGSPVFWDGADGSVSAAPRVIEVAGTAPPRCAPRAGEAASARCSPPGPARRRSR